MTDTWQTGYRGSVRQRIVALDQMCRGRLNAGQIARDRYLRRLVRSGAVTAELVNKALEDCARDAASMRWMGDVHPTVLGRADCVFLAEYGRFPSESGDFEINGPYHRICRSLGYDWHYYDEQLARLHWDGTGRPYAKPEVSVRVEQDVRDLTMRRGNGWLFAIVLAAGLIGGPLAGAAILRDVSIETWPAVWVFGVMWVLCLAFLLATTRPRRTRQRDTVLRCSRCRQELTPGQARTGCLGCGALFAESAPPHPRATVSTGTWPPAGSSSAYPPCAERKPCPCSAARKWWPGTAGRCRRREGHRGPRRRRPPG